MKTLSVQQENARRQANRIFQNQLTVARGTPISNGDSDSYEYGYEDVSFWIPTLQRWIPSEQSFIVHDTDYDSACATFWDKWRSYCQRRFKRNYIKIERL